MHIECIRLAAGPSAALQIRTHIAARAARRWNIAVESVVHPHAIGVETPTQSPDRAFHAFDPTAWQPISIAMVEQRNPFFLQSTEQVFPVPRVVDIHIGMCSAGS